MTNTEQEFRAALEAAGLRTDDAITADGTLHRIHIHGDKPAAKNGWYVLHPDNPPAGAYGSWKHDVQGTWCGKSTDTLTPEERRTLARRMDDARRQREAETEARRAEARAKAARIWDAATPAPADHPYLVRKAIQPYTARLSRGSLVLPVRDSTGTLQSLQFIDAEGNKLFLSGGQKRGCYATIGRPNGTVLVAEGFATAASLHASTGHAVAIAFDAGNLEPVAEALRLKLPDAEIIICADNDNETPGNPGITKATRAAERIGAAVVHPPEGGDFNDLAAEAGPEAVRLAVQVRPQPLAPDTVSPLPDANSRGKPLSTIENLHEICRRLGVIVRYNVISKEEEILIPGAGFSIDNRANASLAWLASWCNRFGMPPGNLGDFVTYLADQNLYNPAAEWITSTAWDGTPRLQQLCDTITTSGDPALKDTLIRRWMISAVAAAFEPEGVSAHGVLVLQGDQYLGKTKWFKTLVPRHLGLTQDGMMLRPDDRDSVKQACSFWLVELGELDATFRKSDIAALKSFLTRQKDVLRRAFARKESEYARRTVFFGSVNPKEFLHDPTGNRRYWTIPCTAINHEHTLDMQQVWAEVYELYRQGETWFLDPGEMDRLNHHNEGFTALDPIEERLTTGLVWSAASVDWGWKTVTQALIEVGIDKPTQAEANRAAAFIRKQNGGLSKRSGAGRFLWLPPSVSDSRAF